MPKDVFKEQVIPIALTIVTAVVLALILWLEVVILNRFTGSDILLHIRWTDILVGLTIYLKTSVDFAIYIGNLMSKNPGWKSRVAIEIGTAAGNAGGTLVVLIIWAFFKEVEWLLALMILVASLVLIELAEEGLEHAAEGKPGFISRTSRKLYAIVAKTNAFLEPVLKYVIPNLSMKEGKSLPFWGLFAFSFTVPFILGLDDFAGYVPLFSVVNVFGFAIGVFVGHMILNIFLFISPTRTVQAVKNPVISFLGAFAFIALAVWGLIEVVRIFLH